jgi:MOSC domain-containing protein YiiM
MRLVSVNTGLPREIDWQGRSVRTSIWKSSRDGRLRVTALNIEGDEQSDLSVHGGRAKALYVYPSEHYEYWRRELPWIDLPWGMFGENLTTEGLLETDVRIGDRIHAGSVELLVTQPRQPCFKLGIRFGRDDMVRRFVASGRSGFYVAVVKEGDVARGDLIDVAHRADDSLTVDVIAALRTDDEGKGDLLRRAIELSALPAGWKNHFQQRLSEHGR